MRLPSGGSIVIEQTEAMVTIDVNSAKDTKRLDIEATALNTNLEAAVEVARQLRFRDLGGLIVVDFIDMLSNENQREVVDTFHFAVENDKARVQYSRISRFGLMEISRQRLRPSLQESSQVVCPRCSGQGTIRSIESMALFILRLLHEDALRRDLIGLDAQLPVSVATYLLNEKREDFSRIERQNNVQIRVIPNPHLETPKYKIDRIYRSQESEERSASKPASFELIETPEIELSQLSPRSNEKTEQPAITSLAIPSRPEDLGKKNDGLIQRLWRSLISTAKEEEEEPTRSRRGAERRRNPERHKQHQHKTRKSQRRNNDRGQRRDQSKQTQPRKQHFNRQHEHHYHQEEPQQGGEEYPMQAPLQQEPKQREQNKPLFAQHQNKGEQRNEFRNKKGSPQPKGSQTTSAKQHDDFIRLTDFPDDELSIHEKPEVDPFLELTKEAEHDDFLRMTAFDEDELINDTTTTAGEDLFIPNIPRKPKPAVSKKTVVEEELVINLEPAEYDQDPIVAIDRPHEAVKFTQVEETDPKMQEIQLAEATEKKDSPKSQTAEREKTQLIPEKVPGIYRIETNEEDE